MKIKTKKFVDLHMHSLYSDGYFTPAQVVQKLKSYNIGIAALADHYSTSGFPEFSAAAKQAGIKAIPAIEIYGRYKNFYLHFLAYNIDIDNAALHKVLRAVNIRKYRLLKKITPLLKRKGIVVDPDALVKEKANYIGMNNILRHIESRPENIEAMQSALGKKDYQHWEVYMKFFSHRCNTHYPEIHIPFDLVLKTVKKAGGVLSLAHPGQQLMFEQDWVVQDLKKKGLQCLECFSSHHKYSQTVHYLRLAKSLDLAATGGSDFHGDLAPDMLIQRIWDYTLLPEIMYRKIKLF